MAKLNLLFTVVLSGSILMTGCASMIEGSTQSVALTPIKNGIINNKATCTASNKKGSWVTAGGGSVILKKASDDLQVRCVDNETNVVGMQTAPKSTKVGWAVANFFLWDFCTISCLIDFGTGSIYEYPSQVQVQMQ